MRVFLTGATGFIGSRIVPELLASGHQVVGMTRSDDGAKSLIAAGASPHRATLEDTAGIIAGAADADAVIHTAFDHDFTNFVANCEKDRRVIAALGSVLKGSDRPLLITSGTGMGGSGDGRLASEDVFNRHHSNPRIASELAAEQLLDEGVNVSVMRLPQVHDTVRQGLISPTSRSRPREGPSPMSETGSIAGPRRTSSTSRNSMPLLSTRASRARATTPSPRRASPPARSRRSWAPAWIYRSSRCPPIRRRTISAGSPYSPVSICPPAVRSRVRSSVGSRPGRT